MQETYPAKLPVPVDGAQFEFTLRNSMTVGELRQAVLANSEKSVRSFTLTSSDGKVDETLTLGQLR